MKLRKNEMKLKDEGIGLIEVMVAAAIFGGLVMAFMRLSDQMMKSEARMFEVMEVQDLTHTLRYEMSNPIACSKTFLDHFPDQLFPVSGELNYLKDKHSKEIAQAGGKYGPVLLDSMKYEADQDDIDALMGKPGIIKVRVHLRFKGERSKNLRKTQSFTAPVVAQYDDKEEKLRFEYCDSMTTPFAAQIVDLTMRRMCESLDVSYDPETGSCDMGSAFADVMGGAAGGGVDFSKLLEQAFPKR